MPFQNDIQNKIFFIEFNYLFTKYSMLKKEMICMVGYVLICRNLLYDSALHNLVYSKLAHR